MESKDKKDRNFILLFAVIASGLIGIRQSSINDAMISLFLLAWASHLFAYVQWNRRKHGSF